MDSEEPNKPLDPETDPSKDAGTVPGDGIIQAPVRKRVRVRVKKRIRIKKKPSAKKKLKKFGEKALWTLIVIGFIIALIILVVELDIKDERVKARRTTTKTR